ncbi:sugar transferase [Nevskia soli]|uniref:sugar transferase n=1 Tax=Nevskia soli TaxID=418856 RepID=UPI0015D6BFFC|nr:sugar transferase [Nevskia soli]
MRLLSLMPAQSTAVLIFDFLITGAVFAGSLYMLLGPMAPIYMTDSRGWLQVLLAVFTVLIGLYFNQLYTTLRVASRVALVLQLSHVLGLSLVLQTLCAYMSPDLALPRRTVLLGTFLCFPALLLWRLAYSGFLWKLFGRQNIILVGNDLLAQELVHGVEDRPERGFCLIGYVGEPVPADVIAAAYLGPFEQLPALVAELKPDRVVVACSDRREGGLPLEELLTLRDRGVLIEEGARMYEVLCSRICSSEFRPAHYIFDQTMVHRPGSLALQSIYLNVMALVGMVVLIPLLLVLAIAVKISTHGGVLDSTPCVGYRGIPFQMHRFRTTRVDAGSGRVVTTRIGRMLRRTHLELLPALLNLSRGEMSLVGPRPCRPEISHELERHIPFFQQRYTLKPGLTGWGQINMSERDHPADALRSLEYDLYYLKHMSLSLDAYILLHQLRQMLSFA